MVRRKTENTSNENQILAMQSDPIFVIRGFCHEVDENCALLGYY